MSLLPPKILGLLDVLDEDSACLAIINNIEGFEQNEKKKLRSMLLSKEGSITNVFTEFISKKQIPEMVAKLKALLCPEAQEPTIHNEKCCITLLQEQNKGRNNNGINKQELIQLTHSTISNTASSSNGTTIPIKQDKEEKTENLTETVELMEYTKSPLNDCYDINNESYNASVADMNASDLPQNITTIIENNHQESEEFDAPFKTYCNPKNETLGISKNDIQPIEELSNCENEKSGTNSVITANPYNYVRDNKEREKKLKDTDAQFKQLLLDSKDYIQTRPTSPKTLAQPICFHSPSSKPQTQANLEELKIFRSADKSL